MKAGDLKIANAFEMSYEQLDQSGQRVFRRLAVVPGQDSDAALAAVAGGMPIEDAWDALDNLVDLGLLQDSGAGHYHFHNPSDLRRRPPQQAGGGHVAGLGDIHDQLCDVGGR